MGTKVLVLYNQPQLPVGHPEAESEHMVTEIADYQVELLRGRGFQVEALALGPEPDRLWTELRRIRPDVILNLYEGMQDDTETESYVAGLLQWSGIPFTGCPMQTLVLARAKHIAKMVFMGSGLPTAPFFVVTHLPAPPCSLTWPVIVKPALQDASVGIEHASVCVSQAELDDRIAHVITRFGGPVLVEEFIPGRELVVAVTELPHLRYMPPGEILFPSPRPGRWPILTYSSKWKPKSEDYETTPPRYPADISAELAQHLGELAMRAFRLVGCRDYARVDFRVNAQGQPFILEVNPNPEISHDACFGHILATADYDFGNFLVDLIQHARTRRTR